MIRFSEFQAITDCLCNDYSSISFKSIVSLCISLKNSFHVDLEFLNLLDLCKIKGLILLLTGETIHLLFNIPFILRDCWKKPSNFEWLIMGSNKFEHIPIYLFKFLKEIRILTNYRKAIFVMSKKYKFPMLRLLPTSTEGNAWIFEKV